MRDFDWVNVSMCPPIIHDAHLDFFFSWRLRDVTIRGPSLWEKNVPLDVLYGEWWLTCVCFKGTAGHNLLSFLSRRIEWQASITVVIYGIYRKYSVPLPTYQGFIAQLVGQRRGIAEVMGYNPLRISCHLFLCFRFSFLPGRSQRRNGRFRGETQSQIHRQLMLCRSVLVHVDRRVSTVSGVVFEVWGEHIDRTREIKNNRCNVICILQY